MNQKQIDKKYPVEVTLKFKNQDEKEEFLGQLSDGWGETWGLDLHWDGDLYKVSSVAVEPPDPDEY